MVHLPELGVGIVFAPGLEPLLKAGEDLIDVIEIEPQIHWFKGDQTKTVPQIDQKAIDNICTYPQKKIVHGVSLPLCNTLSEKHHIELFSKTITLLDASWASEHLAFNQASSCGNAFNTNTGFFLPPLQTPNCVSRVAENISQLSSCLPVPFAFETGVNYLKPLPCEMSDGEFFGAIADKANCGILLDLHNLWCNQVNGRQSALDVVSEIPLERVWEIHLAGGKRFNEYWLDAHCGLVPPQVMELAKEIIPQLQNLKALIFEIVPDYILAEDLKLDTLVNQLLENRKLWALRSRPGSLRYRHETQPYSSLSGFTHSSQAPDDEEWKNGLGSLVIGNSPKSPLEIQLFRDRGVSLYRSLVANVRMGMVVELLKLSFRLIVLHKGEPFFRQLLDNFWNVTPPEQFAIEEARNFARYVATTQSNIAYLGEIIAYELATHQTLLDGYTRKVRFSCDPVPLLTFLGAGQLTTTKKGCFEVTISP